jgi:hypothetical protein
VLRAAALALMTAAAFDAAHGPIAPLSAMAITAAALGLLVLVLGGREALRGERWCTPVDRLVLAGLALSLLQVVQAPGAAEPRAWLRQMLACGFAFYALVALGRRTPQAAAALWPAAGLAAAALGVHAVFTATAGLPALAAHSARADLAWAGSEGLGKAMMLATVVTLGRASEPLATPAWRGAALLGVLGTGLHVAHGRLGLGPQALGRLEEPLHFSVTVASLLLLGSFARRAWAQRRERPGEGARWRAVAAAFVVVAFLGAFGAQTGGLGVRVLVAVMAAATLLQGEAPALGRGQAPQAPATRPTEAHPVREAA